VGGEQETTKIYRRSRGKISSGNQKIDSAAAVENEIEALRLRPKTTKGKIEVWLGLNQT
jgi:hypothetical protein